MNTYLQLTPVSTPQMGAIFEPAAPAMIRPQPGRHFAYPVVAEPRIVQGVSMIRCREIDAGDRIQIRPDPTPAGQCREYPRRL